MHSTGKMAHSQSVLDGQCDLPDGIASTFRNDYTSDDFLGTLLRENSNETTFARAFQDASVVMLKTASVHIHPM